MTRLLTRQIAMAAVLAVLVSACSEPSMSVSEYATALEDGTDAYIAESQVLSGAFQRTVENEIAQLSETGEGDLLSIATEITSRETVQYMSLLEDAMVRYGLSLEALEPPAVLRDRTMRMSLLLGPSVPQCRRHEMQLEWRRISTASRSLSRVQVSATGNSASVLRAHPLKLG